MTFYLNHLAATGSRRLHSRVSATLGVGFSNLFFALSFSNTPPQKEFLKGKNKIK